MLDVEPVLGMKSVLILCSSPISDFLHGRELNRIRIHVPISTNK